LKTRLLLASLFLISGSIQAQEARCSSHPVINVLPFEVTEDFSKTYRELQEIGASNGEVGLVRVRSSVWVSKDGCTATVGYREPVLHVASELTRDACAFAHVKQHELEHVRLYREHLVGIKERIEARVQAGEDLFQASKTEVLAVQAQHQAFDSPEEYSKNRTECSGKIARLALNRLTYK